MSALYSIRAEPALDLIRIRMEGFFTPEDIAGFLAQRAAAHRQLLCPRNHHLTLNDLRGIKIQAQEIVEAFRGMLADPAYRSRRLAFVIDRSLARSQLVRAVANRDVRYFDAPDAAERWLLSGIEDDLAA